MRKAPFITSDPEDGCGFISYASPTIPLRRFHNTIRVRADGFALEARQQIERSLVSLG